MQYKVRFFLRMAGVLIYLFSFSLFAQPIFGPVQQPPVLSQNTTSANDFKNKVKSLGEKNRNELSQQFKQDVEQDLKASPAMTSAPPTSTSSTGTTASTPPAGTTSSQTPAIPGTGVPVDSVETNLPNPSLVPGVPGASPPATAGMEDQSPPAQPGQQGSVYTGFGNTTTPIPVNPNPTAAPPPPAASPGGWNIKY